mmetsp:Transcript_22084/g.44803  ORF Transcript_22084/g.44803 Transcript_22084/m.44803 type:complete len:159 (+) Transcript_22084:124-600(+)|eukprot:CAMPEP_0168311356 /NCGR_PEP_ID=MMETSP0142_2-20121227/67324_1 /TAXON_ID=44445 /ORGANISM="Pseudo-nitzschia australis, Strain 10249 10 AB" /LENGTH=158 /DNA_ID=CAMNT_0008264251 /DNA_START=29 /DNA_END=505 /DNA_ORIENTATION=+
MAGNDSERAMRDRLRITGRPPRPTPSRIGSRMTSSGIIVNIDYTVDYKHKNDSAQRYKGIIHNGDEMQLQIKSSGEEKRDEQETTRTAESDQDGENIRIDHSQQDSSSSASIVSYDTAYNPRGVKLSHQVGIAVSLSFAILGLLSILVYFVVHVYSRE